MYIVVWLSIEMTKQPLHEPVVQAAALGRVIGGEVTLK